MKKCFLSLRTTGVAVLASLISISGCAKSSNDSGTRAAASVVEIAREAYTFGLPLVLVDITRRIDIYTNRQQMNRYNHFDVFPDADFRDIVRPNVDTYYSNSFLDLTGGPIKLTLPNTNGRYHMLQIMDAYSNTITVPGTRTTGNDGGQFLITGPGWTGDVPAGVTEYKSPTNYVWVVGRTQVNSAQDGKNFVVPLMRQYGMEPTEGGPLAEPCNPTAPAGDPNSEVAAMPIDVFFNYLNCLMVINPPAEADKPIMERMAKIGVAPGANFDLAKFSAEEQNEIKNIHKKVMDDLIAYRSNFPVENGWLSMAIKGMGDFGTDYLLRAHIGHFGLGANPPVDAVYLIARTDENGTLLNGANNYTLRFEPGAAPPVNAFWSLTVYNSENYLSANPINRYAIGDRSNLKENEDGSISIYIQHTSPGSDKESNWLPVPADAFDLTLRAYYPKEALSNGSWKMPGVKMD